MSTVRRSSRQRRVVLALALITGAIAACDSGTTTAPAPIRPAPTTPAAIEGDTLACRHGWTIIGGRYVCKEET